jgi:hypothetical protein
MLTETWYSVQDIIEVHKEHRMLTERVKGSIETITSLRDEGENLKMLQNKILERTKEDDVQLVKDVLFVTGMRINETVLRAHEDIERCDTKLKSVNANMKMLEDVPMSAFVPGTTEITYRIVAKILPQLLNEICEQDIHDMLCKYAIDLGLPIIHIIS